MKSIRRYKCNKLTYDNLGVHLETNKSRCKTHAQRYLPSWKIPKMQFKILSVLKMQVLVHIKLIIIFVEQSGPH